MYCAKSNNRPNARNDDPCDKYWLWRFMIDESLQGKGYGSAALKEIIRT